MEELLNHTASRIALSASGISFMTGSLTGLWKYLCIRQSQKTEAHHFVNTAHCAELMYGFAGQMLAVFAATSAFSDTVNIVAVIFPLLFFSIAIIHYIILGLTTESNNSIRDSAERNKEYWILNILAVSEIGGFSALLAGFFLRL